jgi:cbb3-type cytochrome oxidase subunit 3
LLKQSATVDNNASFTLLLVFTLIYILLQFFAYKNNESIGFSNLFYIASLVQALASVNNIVIRVGYYFMPYLCIALPNLIVRRKKISVVEYRAWFMIVVICFSVFGLYSIYSTYWAQAYPYKFFLQEI